MKISPRTHQEIIESYREHIIQMYKDDEKYDKKYVSKINDLENYLESLGIINPKEWQQEQNKELTKMVKEVRDKTGAGIMDCKRALEDNDYDVQKASVWLYETRYTRTKRRTYTEKNRRNIHDRSRITVTD